MRGASVQVLVAALCCATVVAGCARTAGALQSLPANPSYHAAQLGATSLATESVLYRFTGGTDGERPLAGLTALNGVLYGTTAYGGTSNNGTVFKVTTSGAESVLYSFKGGADGALPQANLTLLNGTFYGTTSNGGATGNGTVFKVSPSGNESVLYSFKGGTDGSFPQASLISKNGILYGTTYFGGSSACTGGCGTVFKITTAGQETVLYRFQGGTDGAAPAAALVAANGNFYGTTLGGSGSVTTACPDEGVPGCGTVFEISPTGTEHVLRDFKGGTGARTPMAPLVFINGWLYGTTAYGGASNNGTVFKLYTAGPGYKILHSFTGADGSVPQAGLTELGGTLYGTTDYGGTYGGTVFNISTSGTFGVIYDFQSGSDGHLAAAKLVALSGVLYGTTYSGGTGCSTNSGCGTVYAVTP
jgi:uncharacterized repeat protein (TIGR03803 family)